MRTDFFLLIHYYDFCVYWFKVQLNLSYIFFVSCFFVVLCIEKIYSNGLLKDAINNRSICTPIRFSHDRPSNGANDGKTTIGQSPNATNGKVNIQYLIYNFKNRILKYRFKNQILNFCLYLFAHIFQKKKFVCIFAFVCIFCKNKKIPSPPTNCCMSGCANCVWLQYAEEISSQLQGGSDAARKIIMKEVQDPNMRSFLEMELRMLKLNEKK